MADRYVVTETPDRRGFGIMDRDLYAYCTLVDENQNALPLEWQQPEAAEFWLRVCFRKWRAWEGDKKRAADVPLRWRPHPPANSPFDRGYQFYN